jgi:energy-coupling factor transporter ATP-binding protein EcfA2
MADQVLMNPFPGLRAFEEDEDILFFGREKQIDELLRKLRTSRFLAIIGSSGSGKSSLVKSGLLPSLHSGLMSGVSSQWRIALFRPGNDPIGNLTEAISKNGILRDNQAKDELETYTSINEAILRRSSLGLIEAYKQSGVDRKNNLLILVDQFEELFRFSRYEKDTREGKRDSIAFINLLLKASEQKELPIYVVFTMRSDFLGDCTEFRGLPEAINEGQYLIPRMTREERREAITGPIAVGGATITPALLNRLLNDVGDNPDQLPILQHALMRTWDVWKRKKQPALPLDIDDYEHIGTITEALSQHAEEAYAELSTEEERQACEKIFKELTDKGGMQSGIRRPRLLSELSAAAGVSDQVTIKIIEIFRKPGRGFLMPAYPVPLTSASIIDISHESLMRVWKRLISWLEEEEESAQVYLHLCEAVNLYETGKGGLWRDPELQVALKWRTEQNTNAAWASRYNPFYDKAIFFLEHSKQQRDLEIKHKEELQKQRLRITRRITAVVSIIGCLALVFAIFALQAKNQANKAEKKAEIKRVEALNEKKNAENASKEALIQKNNALDEKKEADSSAKEAVKQEKNALKQRGIAVQETAKAKIARSDAEDSALAAVRSRNAAIESQKQAIDAKDSSDKSKLKAEIALQESRRLQALAESKTNAHKAALDINVQKYKECLDLALEAYRKNLSSGGDFQDNDIYTALLLSWENNTSDPLHSETFSGPVRSFAALPHSDIFFTADESGNIVTSQYSAGSLSTMNTVFAGKKLRSITVNPQGDYLLAVLLDHVVLFRINSDHSLKADKELLLHGTGKHGIFLDDQHFAVQCQGMIYRYEISNPVHVDSCKIQNCNAIAAGNGKLYISSGNNIFQYNGWPGAAGSPDKTYSFESAVTSIALDGSSKYIAAGTYRGVVWLITPRTGVQHSYGLHLSAVNDLKFQVVGPGKLQLASASSDKTIKLDEVTDDHTLNTNDEITLTEHNNWVYALLYSNDGKYLFSGSEDRSVRWWPATMKELYNKLTKK